MIATKVQISFRLLCGNVPVLLWPTYKKWDITDIIKEGNRQLTQITKVDYGYDLMKWHEYLLTQDHLGYKYHTVNGLIDLAKVTLLNKEWNKAVQKIRGSPNQSLHQSP